jgi:hypothetical protein
MLLQENNKSLPRLSSGNSWDHQGLQKGIHQQASRKGSLHKTTRLPSAPSKNINYTMQILNGDHKSEEHIKQEYLQLSKEAGPVPEI